MPSDKDARTTARHRLEGKKTDLWYQAQEGRDFSLVKMQFKPFTPLETDSLR